MTQMGEVRMDMAVVTPPELDNSLAALRKEMAALRAHVDALDAKVANLAKKPKDK